MALQTASSPAAPSAEVVGNAFVEQYYHILHTLPEMVFRFYQDSSVISRPDANGIMTLVATMQGINEQILSLNFKDYKAEIKTVDAQKSYKEGVTVLVTGCLMGKDNLKKKFAQSFFLAPQDNGYFVLNDVFRYVDDNEPLENLSVNGINNSTTAPSVPDSEPSHFPDPSAPDPATFVVDQNNAAEKVNEPVNLEKEIVYEKEVKVATGNSGPTKVYVSTNTLKVTPKKPETQSTPVAPAAEPEVSVPSSNETPQSSNTPEEEDVNPSTALSLLKILSYNVWFREDLELHKRMKAIGDLIELHSPDVICFQEVTPNIYDVFRQSSWWKVYHCSVSNVMAYSRAYFCMLLSKLQVKSFSCRPFTNSVMKRELCIAELEVYPNKQLVVATSHLESPCPAPPTWDQMFSKELVGQAKEATNLLKKNPNVIFGGDMNWDDKLDGQFPLPAGWIDAWTELRQGDNGWTYDTKSNQMLSGNRTLQKRLDRFVCSLHDFRISKIEMIGKEAIPGLSHIKEKKLRKEVRMLELPVLPSDHYGLFLTISGK